ncbi:phage holin family protein [Actinomadura alba]|uniref:Phage holin family protein n=1 Tax=Actinomadura alba TaxID=406431 RepID=A0ABR7M162_9ACTN|nr:phage holin family protein [Actinomadura alba]MBC6470852.1 phage holin family protein [Actinomadura alba]
MTDVRPEEQIEDRSLGELVALASSNVSRLIRSEIELAKLELKDDAKKAAWGGMLFTIAGVIGGLIVILLSIAAAYGLVAVGIWHWAAFLIVAGFYVVLAAVLLGLGYLRMRKITGIQRTRRTLKDLTAIRRASDTPAIPE